MKPFLRILAIGIPLVLILLVLLGTSTIKLFSKAQTSNLIKNQSQISCESVIVKPNLGSQSQCQVGKTYKYADISCDGGKHYYNALAPFGQNCMTLAQWQKHAEEQCKCEDCKLYTADEIINRFRAKPDKPFPESCQIDAMYILESNMSTYGGEAMFVRKQPQSSCPVIDTGDCGPHLQCDKIFENGIYVGVKITGITKDNRGYWNDQSVWFEHWVKCPCQEVKAAPRGRHSNSDPIGCASKSYQRTNKRLLQGQHILCYFDKGDHCEGPFPEMTLTPVPLPTSPPYCDFIGSSDIDEYPNEERCLSEKQENWSCRQRQPGFAFDGRRYAVRPMCEIAGISLKEAQEPPTQYRWNIMNYVENKTSLCGSRSVGACPDGYTCTTNETDRTVTIRNDIRSDAPEIEWLIGDKCPCQSQLQRSDGNFYFAGSYCDKSEASFSSSTHPIELKIGQSAVCDIDTLMCEVI